MAKPLNAYRYLTFDVVGTLIDFEGGIKDCLTGIAAEAGTRAFSDDVDTGSSKEMRQNQKPGALTGGNAIGQRSSVDGEEALSLYRAARYAPEAGLFPDDLARVYGAIAPALGLPADPAFGERLRDSAKTWKAFPDSAAALARLAEGARLIAMTNARRWAFAHFAEALGNPFHAAFTADDTGTEKPDPAFFEQVIAFVEREGGSRADILHVAQSQYHDIGVSRRLGLANCWIERRHAQEGYGGTIAPEQVTTPDFHFTSMAGLAEAVAQARA